jgi:soluble lytic murein transglycosylase
LALFRIGLAEQPGLFLQHPALIIDLGRGFQFGSSGNEGIELFLEWEKQAEGQDLARYRLLFFAGRIARARGAYGRSRELFTQALAFAPDELQSDAAVWYILDTALQDTSLTGANLVARLKTWMPRWHDPSYFNDILDRVSRILAASGQWQRFPEVLALLQAGPGDRASTAKYAYITGRAIAGGLIPPESAAPEAAARRYFRVAYDAGEQALYYRALSAYFLGEPFLSLEAAGSPQAREVPNPAGGRAPGGSRSPLEAKFSHPREMEFLLGFFTGNQAEASVPSGSAPSGKSGAASGSTPSGKSGAASGNVPSGKDAASLLGLVYPRIEAMAAGLDIEELRVLAEALEQANAYPEHIRLAASYMGRKDYALARRDLELISPRPFRELVEGRAQEAGFSPELLYGLLRTESAFQPEIVSHAGAVGLTQLMPATAADMAGRLRRQGGPDYTGDMNSNLRDPDINIHLGAFYLAYLQNLLDHPLLTLLSYNGGMNRVRRWFAAARPLSGDLFLETIEYPETRDYGRRVLSAAAVYGYLYYDMNLNTLLADICR